MALKGTAPDPKPENREPPGGVVPSWWHPSCGRLLPLQNPASRRLQPAGSSAQLSATLLFQSINSNGKCQTAAKAWYACNGLQTYPVEKTFPECRFRNPHLFLLCLQISSCPSQPVGSSDMPCAYPTSGLCAPKACSTRRRSSWRPATRLCLATAKPSWDLVENCSGHLEVREEAVEFQNHPKPELPMLKGHF